MVREARVLWRGVESTWTWLRGDERFEQTLRHRLYSGAELDALLLRAGFSSVQLFGGFDQRRYDHEAMRLQALATV